MEISIVTCVRNQDPILFQECADSVANQDENLEWIIIDDLSSSESIARYQDVISSLPSRVDAKLVCSDTWRGLAGARNTGIALATGNWTVILDSDDRLANGLASRLLALSKNTTLACFEVNYFDEEINEHRRIRKFERLFRDHAGTALDPFLWYDFYYHGILVRREILLRIGGYLKSLTVGEDQDVLLRAVEAVDPDSIVFIHTTGYEYRRNPKGICNTKWSDVLTNYTSTMLEAASRRGASFVACRFGGVEYIDGASIDSYEYETPEGHWYSWHDWYQEVANAEKR